ncbi:hypothetical protein RHE_PC00230 (plasmid) [Rhizobium etli CFN 42]|uniref:Uncharacterized protein n=1 Tax=Rhizobium etli (strain ATCC 51251 / DSM 11541 / JCM 21823 / NBRC 15573 / CFN 42) TaxID=347834 RepID=Q2K1S6_RHIEC|nr:hypothetical protein [Rhizobium etli]ABC93435.1 hypothetical protein RHE_PC00230 [Rhizobium etli CFN 42]AGS24353.1 hypothetical protein REMIM1_PB00235 [Rhizobium etli bv. mimosae str. Mim1]
MIEPLSFSAVHGKDGDKVGGRFSAGSNCAYLSHASSHADERWKMNFKGISAPLNAGRLEQMLGLAPSRRDPESQDGNVKSSCVEPARGLEAESLCRSSAYK